MAWRVPESDGGDSGTPIGTTYREEPLCKLIDPWALESWNSSGPPPEEIEKRVTAHSMPPLRKLIDHAFPLWW